MTKLKKVEGIKAPDQTPIKMKPQFQTQILQTVKTPVKTEQLLDSESKRETKGI
jgi:hypothetical protein